MGRDLSIPEWGMTVAGWVGNSNANAWKRLIGLKSII